MKKIALILALLSMFSIAQAADRFVTDEFKITLRSGMSPTHKIIRMLPSGSRLKLIRSDRDSGYSEVETEDGRRGFVLTRQLMDTPSARDRLSALEKRVQELLSEPEKLATKLNNLQSEHSSLNDEYAKLSQEKQEIETELNAIKRTASNALRISEERNELRGQVSQLTREVADLKQANLELENQSDQRWFMIGAGVLVVGIVLGLIIPNLRMRKRKSSWGSL